MQEWIAQCIPSPCPSRTCQGPVLRSSKLATAWVGDPVDVSDLLRDYHARALERANDRNAARGARLAAALAAEAAVAAPPGLLTIAVDAMRGLLGYPSFAASQAAVAAAAAAATSVPPARLAGARSSSSVAGLSQQASSDVAAAASATHLSEGVQRDGSATASDAASELVRDVGAAASQAVDSVSEAGGAIARKVAQVAVGLEGGIADMARDAEARARELKARLSDVERRLRELAGVVDAPKASDTPGAAMSTPSPRPQSAFEGSISVPQPLPAAVPAAQLVPESATPSTPSPSPASGASDGPRRTRAGTGAVPLSQLPVIEVVPTRTLPNGVVVPTYVEAPLRAKPPDHEFLTLDEARVSHAACARCGVRTSTGKDLIRS